MFLLIVAVVIFIPLFIWYIYLPHRISRSPFQLEFPKLKLPVFDQKERAKVLKQGFSVSKVSEKYDAIVVGSGIGGLATAAILSKAGWKVLVLEQHDQAGGCCHTFIEKGYEFDVGVHYIGEMIGNKELREFFDQITDGQLQWSHIDENFDTAVVHDDKLGIHKTYPMAYGSNAADAYRKQLVKNFPNEIDAIDKYVSDVLKMELKSAGIMVVKLLPKWLVRFLISSGLLNLLTGFFTDCRKSLKTYMEELTDNVELRVALSYSFGDYGVLPQDAPWPMQALLCHHFLNGASYPKGGSSEIAFNIIPVIEKSGGKVLVRANVEAILLEDGKAIGVSVKKNDNLHNIYAPVIISDAGVANTLQKLLPSDVARKMGAYKALTNVGPGWGAVSLFVGFKGTAKQHELRTGNYWIFSDNDINYCCTEFLKMPDFDSALSARIPLLFVAFPSAKDPDWEKKYPGKSACTVVSLANFEWFAKWNSGKVMKRGDEYEAMKKQYELKLWEQIQEFFPQLKEAEVEYMELGSPVTNNYYLGSTKGEIYGLDHGMERFNPKNMMELRAKTELPGLYLTGQDILSGGVSGAMLGASLCAGELLDRYIFLDLMQLCSQRNRNMKKDE